MPRDTDAVLLSGVTGFVGAAVLARYLESTERPVVALARAGSPSEADDRVRAVLHDLYEPGLAEAYGGRCTAVAADLEQPGLGLGAGDREDLAQSVNEVVHCAASVSFDQPLAAARAVNVDGAGRIAELAELCSRRGRDLERLVHVSTAYVAGEHDGVFSEDNTGAGRSFRNTYEQTKHEAEALLRSRPVPLPLQIVRPSIVVGDAATGWTRAFNVLYWPLQMFAKGHLPVIPATSDAPVDAVSVDYVADAILALNDAPPATYHVVAGDQATTVGEITALASRRFGLPEPVVVPPERLAAAMTAPLAEPQRRALERARVYFPYFDLRVRFDDRRARRQLAGAGVHPAPLSTYFDRLMDYAERARWGRSPLPRRELAVVA
jgi:thioester reductase-like protein